MRESRRFVALVLVPALLSLAVVGQCENRRGARSVQGNQAVADDEFGRRSTQDERDAAKQLEKYTGKVNEINDREKTASPAQRAKDQKRLAAMDREVGSLAEKFKRAPEVQVKAAGFKLMRGDYKAAGRYAEQGLKRASPDGDPRLTAELLVIGGNAKFLSGDVPGAYQDGVMASRLDPGNYAAVELVHFTKNRGYRLTESDTGERAKRALALQDRSIPHTPEEWAREARRNPTPAKKAVAKSAKHWSLGRLGKAHQAVAKAFGLNARDPMAHVVRGGLRLQQGDLNGAILDFSYAIERGWLEAKIFRMRGEALLHGKKHAKALHDAEHAVLYGPDNADNYFLRFLAKYKLDRPAEEFLADLKKAASLDPGKYASRLDDLLARRAGARALQASAEEAFRPAAKPAPAAGTEASVFERWTKALRDYPVLLIFVVFSLVVLALACGYAWYVRCKVREMSGLDPLQVMTGEDDADGRGRGHRGT